MDTDSHMRRIRVLPQPLANQIAAGEVVERPASVVKELLENSVDAGARRIQVDVEQGGVRLIRVRDDGCGIHRDDLALVLSRHATSKISSFADLQQVASLGFRGEALSSICAVSRLAIISRVPGQEHGWRLVASQPGGGVTIEPEVHPVGTTVEVRDLFFNTPARRKFLRSEKTEQRHLAQVANRITLGRFETAFAVHYQGRPAWFLPPARTADERRQRIAKVCGARFAEQALCIEFEACGLRLMGWVASVGLAQGASDVQHFFVNGRWVRDSLVNHAIRQAYQEKLAYQRQPAYVLYLDADPQEVDVNVHPTKHEVRFRQGRLIHDFLFRSLSRTLAAGAVSRGDEMAVEARCATSTILDDSHLGDAEQQEVLGGHPGWRGSKYASVMRTLRMSTVPTPRLRRAARRNPRRGGCFLSGTPCSASRTVTSSPRMARA